MRGVFPHFFLRDLCLTPNGESPLRQLAERTVRCSGRIRRVGVLVGGQGCTAAREQPTSSIFQNIVWRFTVRKGRRSTKPRLPGTQLDWSTTLRNLDPRRAFREHPEFPGQRSFGIPSTRWAMIPRWISEVPAAMVRPRE
jgi:hypothetical protein